MSTIEYKGFYIHGYCDDYKVKVNFIDTKQIVCFSHDSHLFCLVKINMARYAKFCRM